MQKNNVIITLIILLLSQTIPTQANILNKKMADKSYDITDIISLFIVTPDNIKNNTPQYLCQAQDVIDNVIAIPDTQRTFANTVQPIDEVIALSNASIARAVYHSLEWLSPDENIRNAAHEACITIEKFFIDQVTSNKKLYNAFTAYAANNQNLEQLSSQQRYFIAHTIDNFNREGLSLPDETLKLVTTLRKELINLTTDFQRNIANDNSSIMVTEQELAGLNKDFIDTLTRTSDGLYKVGIDYSTYSRVMESCAVAQTRKKLHSAFNNRAYPANNILLKTIVEKRDQLAQLLGYNDFAHCDLDSQMVHTPERAQAFITDIVQKSQQKVKKEIVILTNKLPESVELTQTGQIQPWDFSFIVSNYTKNHFNLDEQEYFPMKKTVAELLDIYSQFFNIDFQEIPTNTLWHEDVTVIRVNNKENHQLLGTLMLDLYPRPNKHNHPCEITIIPGLHKADGTRVPSVAIVVANFTKPSALQPSLLKSSEVQTFFHEFGHALHEILGATEIASLSGTNTKTDFVELPSQMLEEWLMDKHILKKVSGHYLTGQPLPDEVIDTMIKLKKLISGCMINQQAYFAQLSLSYFGLGANKDPQAIMQDLHTKIMPHVAWAEDNNLYASFGHLANYGAKYYGYLWSKVFALDLFATIKQYGLLNPEIGQKYINEVIGKGGAQNPNELLYNFLGREPNSQAFFADMGL